MIMKTVCVLGALFSVCYSLFAQINTSTIDVAKPISGKMMQATAPYDSTYNLPTNKTRSTYIGQMVYVQHSSNPRVDYSWFRGVGEKDNMMDRYYIVESIEDNTGVFSRSRPYVITFRDVEKDSIRFKYEIDFDNVITHDWVTVSYFNHLKSLIGDKFYCLQKKSVYNGIVSNYVWAINDSDIYTGERIEISRVELWELVDFKAHKETKRLIALFKNTKGQTSYAEIMDFGLTPLNSYYLLPEKEFKRLTKKYGTYYTQMILQDKYAKGMPKELFRLMKGSPYDINSSSYQEQWVYYDKYGDLQCFYFQNGKLTDWN